MFKCQFSFIVSYNSRYDVRGHLYSESEFGLRKNDTDVDIVEAKLEEELDKERFMFLTVDELEFEAYLGKVSFAFLSSTLF